MIVCRIVKILHVGHAKLIVQIDRTQIEILIEPVPKQTSRVHGAFHYGYANCPILYGDFVACVIPSRGLVQVTAGKQQAKPLVRDPHSVKLDFGPGPIQ